MKFAKYHGLGNDYLVFDSTEVGKLTASQIRRICDRHYGPGGDGILYGPLNQVDDGFHVRIFNPDGSEAEKSGNGLRIFARYLWDKHLVGLEPFTIMTSGGQVWAQLDPDHRQIRVEMGQVSFRSQDIPVAGPEREVLDERLDLTERSFRFSAATLGNPHCVILDESLSSDLAQTWGALIERDPRFPRRTNVQFLEVVDEHHLRLEIWERGAGYTLASGSSSCAAAAVAHRLGLCASQVEVSMPGGSLLVQIEPDFHLTLSGPVVKIYEGLLSPECFED